MPATIVEVAQLKTPIGPMAVSLGPSGLVSVDFKASNEEVAARLQRRLGAVKIYNQMHTAAAAIAQYFAGNLRALQPLKVDPRGTPFQLQVWIELMKIPLGTTTSYGALAAKLGRPTASRAVAAANGDNPIAIVIPCHRVIGTDGSLTGYGGGLEAKQWLLRHERAILV